MKKIKFSVDREEIMDELQENGYCIVRDVIDEEQVKTLTKEFFDYLGHLNPELTTDPNSWKRKEGVDPLPLRTKGLIQHYGVGVQPHAVHARMLLKPLFTALWETDKLLTSWDGTSFDPRHQVFRFSSLKDWKSKQRNEAIHIDQTTLGFSSIQCGLALSDQTEDDRCFVCIPKSHQYHEDILHLHNEKPSNKNWLIMNDETLDYLENEKELVRTRISLNKGDCILWDSRLVHASAGPCKTSTSPYRLQVFACMAPVPKERQAYQKELEKRQSKFKECRTSKHSAPMIRFFPPTPRTYGNTNVPEFQAPIACPNMTKEEQYLHGLVAYPEEE